MSLILGERDESRASTSIYKCHSASTKDRPFLACVVFDTLGEKKILMIFQDETVGWSSGDPMREVVEFAVVPKACLGLKEEHPPTKSTGIVIGMVQFPNWWPNKGFEKKWKFLSSSLWNLFWRQLRPKVCRISSQIDLNTTCVFLRSNTIKVGKRFLRLQLKRIIAKAQKTRWLGGW